MTEQYQEFSQAGAEVIALVSDTLEAARVYIERHAIPFPCLVDQTHVVYGKYKVERVAVSLGQRPGLFIVDMAGIVRYAHIGWQQWEIPKNDTVLEVCRSIDCRVVA